MRAVARQHAKARLGALLAIAASTHLAFWLLWPLVVVALERDGYGTFISGVAGATPWVAMLGGAAVAPQLLARFGDRVTTAVACLVIASGPAIAATINDSLVLLAASVLAGLGTGVRWTAVDSWLARSAGPAFKGRVLAIGEVLAGLAFAAGPAIAAVAPNEVTFTVATLLPIIALIAVRLGPDATELEMVATAEPALLKGFVLLIVAVALFGGLFESGFAAVAALFSLETGSSENDALWAAAAVGAGSFVVQYAIGAAADRLGGLRVLRACATMVTASMVLLAVEPSSLLIVSLVIGAFGGGLYTAVVILGVQTVSSAGTSRRVIGGAASAYIFGTLVAGPVSGGALAIFGARATALIFAAACLCLTIWLVVLTRRSASTR